MVLILTGVLGVGKTTIGQLLATKLGWKFFDSDDFHPSANIDKMKQGIPLDDNDRIPWLSATRKLIDKCIEQDQNAVIACSALKESYREYLMRNFEEITLVYLQADYDVIKRRLKNRHGHFAGEELLLDQFTILEEPEYGLCVDASKAPAAIIESIKREIQL